ncbi:hypothetical protein [Leptospira noguchii]|uniref:hypothetical protein n=1 Tax=Leptospira noguchii TaxID=28182 RepID=UPI001FB71B51|nr:hypothetical protein [Leptospira noguchii]UOG47872.1 hypothetical protein MAL00_12480 [Leptospira noguchii]
MNELKQNTLLNSASHSLNSMHRFLRVALQVVRQVELTQQNAFYESVNSAKRFLWVVRQVELTQQNASYGSRFRVNKL